MELNESNHRTAESDQTGSKVSSGQFTDVDRSAWEREIEQQVYALYGLTPEEIQIVEEVSQ